MGKTASTRKRKSKAAVIYPKNKTSLFQQIIQLMRYILMHGRKHMGIGIHSDSNRAMPKPFLYLFLGVHQTLKELLPSYA